MCLLTFIPADVQPDMDALYNGTVFNEDGHGYAIVDRDQLIIRKGLKAEAVLESFKTVRAAHPHGPALFHSRMSTHGSNNVKNCHPFHVGGDRRTVIAHNGILPKDVWPSKTDHRSDTRIAAEDFIPRLGSLKLRRTRLAVEKWMQPQNKIVILTVNPQYRASAFILNEEAGIWEADGIWYSNDGYLPYYTPKSKYPLWWEEGERYAKGDDHWPRSWTHCEECDQPWSQCDCYVPASKRGTPISYINGNQTVTYHPATGKTEVTTTIG